MRRAISSENRPDTQREDSDTCFLQILMERDNLAVKIRENLHDFATSTTRGLAEPTMGLFQRKRFVWNEPWFFQQRIRPKKVWALFLLFLLVVAVAIGASMFFSGRARQPLDVLKVIGMSFGAAAALWWIVDGANVRRQAILVEDSIVVSGDMGKYSRDTTYKLSEIVSAAIVLPEESKWPERALYFHYQGEEKAIGIESKVSLTRLAQALHEAGVPVRLEGWQPNQASEWQKAFSWEADPTRVAERAKMEALPPGATDMITASGTLLAIVCQSWAVVLSLMITGAAAYYGYQNWNNLGFIQKLPLFAIPVAAMYVAGQFTKQFALASASQGLIRLAKQQMRKRDGVQLNPDASDLIPVEIFTRDQFAKTIQRMRDLGFLQPDPGRGRMLFEGKKERWSLPAASIQSLALEEVQIGTAGQSATGALQFYAVVRFAADDVQEFGFRYAQREFGQVDDIKRAEGGVRVYEAFESLVSRG